MMGLYGDSNGEEGGVEAREAPLRCRRNSSWGVGSCTARTRRRAEGPASGTFPSVKPASQRKGSDVVVHSLRMPSPSL